MTHFENIKAMSIEELSFFLAGVQSDICEKLGMAVGMPFGYTDDEIQSAASEWQELLMQEVCE